ncbi:unnamed protein product [Arabis nemorensis]|uniref:Uncharacterized protein n=1 Tax=Arabis nemorensis TaxID=586526 RepID=A0A565B813_9BRAS|nr:unnamed protein product [Arabis nemorensis]
MATALYKTTTSSNLYHHHHSILPPFSPPFHLHRRTSFLLATPLRLRRLAVVGGGPPSPPSPDPPPPEDTTQLAESRPSDPKEQPFLVEMFLYMSCRSCDKDSRPRKDLPRSVILDVSLLLGYSDRWEG